MNRTAGVMKMHWHDKFIWIYTPWIILLFSFVVNLIIGIFTGGKEDFNTGGIISIFIYMFICSMVILGQTFPFALGMNVRRTDFFVGTSVMGLLVCAASGVILFLLSILEKLTDGWGVHLHYFNIPFINHISSFARFGIYFIVLVHMFFLGLVISSVYRRYKRSGMFVLSTVIFICSSITSFVLTYYGMWLDLFSWFSRHYMELFFWMAPVAILYALLSYGMLRRATV
ncbi:hypothetical protein [Paenibacillus sp.]|jgi:hypothetical protein|uniref:hypothetical protein n=1 Tax=Paenibacillus sp. TaxID=58172 RepID=UPI00281E6EDB|nr:hypothetical protein [Paenibacillus sp.]MDR0270569.1 hypothetical protein [Paenibacillus sp.]